MSSPPSLPWEVVERVIDHSADSTETLYSFTLTCRDLRPRSTIVLLGSVFGRLKNRDQLLALCAFLQTKPHLLPCVRSITIPADEFSPYPLFRILPKLSEIKLTKIRGTGRKRSRMIYPLPRRDIEPTNMHASVLKCCHQLGQHIRTLSLQNLFLSSLSTLSDLLLSLPGIESLSCEDIRVGKNRVHEERITRRLKERLRLRTLTIGKSNDDIVLTLLREATKHSLVTLVYEGFLDGERKHPDKIILPSLSDWVELTSFIWRPRLGNTGINFQLESAVNVLRNLHPPKLQEVAVAIEFFHFPSDLLSSSHPAYAPQWAELEKTLKTLPQPTISFSSWGGEPLNLNNRRHHSWMPAVERLFPALAKLERRALRINAKYSGDAGHDSRISTPMIVISADSRWAATGSADHTIIIWDLESGRISQEWMAEDTMVDSLAFSPNSRYIVSVGRMRVARPQSTARTGTTAEDEPGRWATVWDLHQGGRRVGSLQGKHENGWDHLNLVLFLPHRDCAWSPDGTWIAVGAPPSNVIRIWETTTFQCLRSIGTSTWKGSVLLASSADGRWVVTTEHSNYDRTRPATVWIWSMGSGELHRALGGHVNVVRAAAFSPGSTRVATGSWDSTIRIWDAQTGTQLLVLQERAETEIDAVAFSGDGRMVLSHSSQRSGYKEDGVWYSSTQPGGHTVKVWDASNGALLASLLETRTSQSRTPHSACFSPCGGYVAAVSDDNRALLWRTSDWSCIAEVWSGRAPVTCVAISPDGRVICCGTDAGTVFFRRMHDLISASQG